MIDSDSKKILDDLVELSARHLDGCLERSIKVAKTQLFEKLQHLSDNEQSDYSYAVNLLESNVEWIVNKMSVVALKALAKGQTPLVDASPSASPDTSVDSGPELSLVSKDEFEDWLLVDVSKKKLERELGERLTDVCQVFSRVQSRDVNEGNLPVGPEQLLTLLKHAIDALKIPPVAQITIYRSATASLSGDLNRLYGEIVTRAAQHGVKVTKEARKVGSRTASGTSGRSQHRVDVEDSGSHGVQQEAIRGDRSESVQDEMARQRYSSLNTLARLGAVLQNGNRLGDRNGSEASSERTESRSGLGDNPAFEISPLLLKLKQSKTKQIDQQGLTSGSLKDWVRQELSAADRSESDLSESESELIDVTDSLFDAISLQIKGNKTLERWLAKLKLVILKSVLSDQSFFTNSEHPARTMLNRLGNLAEIVESGHTRLQSILDRSIDKVVNEYDQDTSSIDDVVAELSGLFGRHVAAYKRNSERLAHSYEGKQKVAKVRHKVISDMNALLAGKQVPEALLDLVDKNGWREYLALTAVRDGEQGKAYLEGLACVSQLLYWISTLYGDNEEQANEVCVEVGMESSSLLSMIERELSGLGKTGYQATLQVLQDALSGDAAPAFVQVDSYDWPFGEGEQELRELLPKPQDSSKFSRWHRQLLGMKTGDWLQLEDNEGGARVLRLAWAGTESFRFVFVDTQGMKDEDMSLDQLAEMLRDGRARLIEHSDVPLVDQGLHRMVQETYEELSGQANCDGLTGLLTRQALERALDQTAALSMSLQSNSAFLFADINDFNVANNTYGHAAGDSILRHLANVLRDLSGENSFCGRLGGNEFGIILQTCSVEQAKRVADSIRTELAQNAPVFKGGELKINLSIGVAEINHEVDDYDSVLRKSELACKEAKAISTGGVVVYEPQSHDIKRRNEFLFWVKKLNNSLDDLLSLRVQEIRPIEEDAGHSSHWEILLGIKHEGEVIPPSPLIEAAEHFGKMSLIDEWVVKSSLAWMEAHRGFVEQSGGFSINLSGNSLSDHSFLDVIEELVDNACIPADKICFEITETCAIVNLNYATEFIRVLKRKGCKFSLDDFGSGLSSYAYIQKLPVDYIKIDGLFIRNLVNSENDQALVRSINELAHFIGIETVAEFVENHEILEVLRAIGVDHSQGYGIRKPMSMSELVDATS